MPDRYWVGGTGTWSNAATANWSASSGGLGGASAPTSADNVFFDVSSGTGTVTVASGATCATFTSTSGYNGVITGSSVSVIGSLYIRGLNSTSSFLVSLANAGTNYIEVVPAISTLNITITTGTYNLSSNITSINGGITLNSGALYTNGFSLNLAYFLSQTTNGRAIDFGSSQINLTSPVSPSGSIFSINSTSLSFSSGTSNITIDNSSSAIVTFPVGSTFNNVTIFIRYSGTATGSAVSINSNVFNNLSIQSLAGITDKQTPIITIINYLTITGLFSLNTLAGCTPIQLRASESFFAASPSTLNIASFASGSKGVTFCQMAVTGTAAPISGEYYGDALDNSNIVFSAPKTVYFADTTASSVNFTGYYYSFTAGGTVDPLATPLPQDTAVFTDYAPLSGAFVFLTNMKVSGINALSRTTPLTFVVGASSLSVPVTPLYGDVLLSSSTTLFGTGSPTSNRNVTVYGRKVQNLYTGGISGSSIGIRLISPGGTLRLQGAVTLTRTGNGQFDHRAGTLDLNGYGLYLTGSVSSILFTASSASSVNFNGGLLSVAGAGIAVLSTNLTVTYNSTSSIQLGTILNPSISRSFTNQGKAWPSIVLTPLSSGYSYTITGGGSFYSLTFDPTIAATASTTIIFGAGETFDFLDPAGGFYVTGTASFYTLIRSSTTALQVNLRKPTSWAVNNSVDSGNNPGVPFGVAGSSLVYLDLRDINAGVVASIPESGLGADSLSPLVDLSISDVSNIQDASTGALLWNPIDDIQYANWQNINTTQAPGWANTPTDANPSWVNVDTN